MTETDRTEFDLIDRIVARLGDVAASDILVPSGDDAAVWASDGPTVATIDALVEGTHWRADTMSLADVGWRAIAASASDIAAMGATPRYALVAATLTPSMDSEAVDGLIDGLAASCRQHDVEIAGGDIVRGNEAAVTVTMLGVASVEDGAARLLRRDDARTGDAIAVSGHPGASGAGLALIDASRGDEAAAKPLTDAHRRPIGRVALGLAATAAGLGCAIDISDGLLQDLGHIARKSDVGLEVDLDALPLHAAAVELLGREGSLDLALGGGEDFELAIVGNGDVLAALSTSDLPVTAIGRVVEAHRGEAWAVTGAGNRYEPPSAGWDQLRSGGSS
ncbi:MAG TPA: thiamine-phosphate kinase [Dehalococcoidia bacterium]|nr:thiamine-phosphate kinase [Dehalococcoidia bacterium]